MYYIYIYIYVVDILHFHEAHALFISTLNIIAVTYSIKYNDHISTLDIITMTYNDMNVH